MRIIGLTGGSGSGKTAAAKRFAELGFPVVDADAIGHALLASGGAAVDAVAEAFGDEMRIEGGIDRGRLGARVFSDPDALARLNGIVHPALFAEVARQCSAYAEHGEQGIILDAALLGEAGAKEDWLAGLILVVSPVEMREQRLVAYRGLDPERAAKQIAAQMPPEEKAKFSDWIIQNDGTLSELYAQVDTIAEEIRGAAL